MLKVAKFGGSSMANAGQFAKIKAIIESDPSRMVVVVSAAGKGFKEDHKVTDLLYLCHAHIRYGVSAEPIWEQVRQKYLAIREECGLSTDIESAMDAIWSKMQSGIDEDELVSRGEYLAARLMADYLGFEFLDAANWLTFRFDGEIDTALSYEKLVKLADGKKVVIPGFYGAMPDGRVKTLTRGGSDVTGALAAAALGADVYENWTDVSGILMADPRIVKSPKQIFKATYGELRELSYIGAQVLHERAVFPVREKGIPLNIRNTNEPDNPGTMILESIDDDESDRKSFITGLAGKKGFTAITVSKVGLTSTPGYLRSLLEVLNNHGVSVSYLPNGIDSVSLVVESSKISATLYSILGEMQKTLKPDNINVTEHLAIVAAVGRRMAFRKGVAGRLFGALGAGGINIRMITQAPDELSIIVGVEERDFEDAVKVLYSSFAEED